MTMFLLHATQFAHPHPHLDPVVICAIIAGVILAGLVLRLSADRLAHGFQQVSGGHQVAVPDGVHRRLPHRQG